MRLKEYQKEALDTVEKYLFALADKREVADEVYHNYGERMDFAKIAWDAISRRQYNSTENGIKVPLPNFFIKIPTGGGKTLLACHTIDLINNIYLKKQTGLVTWIVPTSQIYRQTLIALKNRNHPYRQTLDISSGGRTIIVEKLDGFSKLDVEENLVILVLMLQSSNRKTKERLKVYRDSGGHTSFFPYEDDYKANNELLKEIPNLDKFESEGNAPGLTIKTSLANTLRVVKPIIIIDEGHKAYSEGARKTIEGFNPSILVELSATPPKGSNILVNIGGRRLDAEEMIKLDLHIINKSSLDWKDTMRASSEHRINLEEIADEYKAEAGKYVRPINLIQVERTGKDQREKGYIHSEDVKEFLIKELNIPEEQIAIKAAEKDDIEGIDLLSEGCPIRYIITKYALQEGWDCPFAYVLSILTNPKAQLHITQLVGRILRQPYAKKTGTRELDESYVFCFRPGASDIVKNVKSGLESEGLEDVVGQINIDNEWEDEGETPITTYRYRKQFREFEGKIYLPKFKIKDNGEYRDVNYEMDIISRIDWDDINLNALTELSLSEIEQKEDEIILGYKDEALREKRRTSKKGIAELDKAFVARQITDFVPNPWYAHSIAERAIRLFLDKYGESKTAFNLVFIVEEIRKLVIRETNRMAEGIFKNLIDNEELFFYLLASEGGFKLPSHIQISTGTPILVREDNTEIQRNLFEVVPEDGFNDMERSIAIYIDKQEKLLWWYRNIAKVDYSVQAWRKNKIYADFIFSDKNPEADNRYRKIYVVETKGTHLKNEDTDYKKDVFAYINELGKRVTWDELNEEFPDNKFEFQVIFENEWQSEINKIFEAS